MTVEFKAVPAPGSALGWTLATHNTEYLMPEAQWAMTFLERLMNNETFARALHSQDVGSSSHLDNKIIDRLVGTACDLAHRMKIELNAREWIAHAPSIARCETDSMLEEVRAAEMAKLRRDTIQRMQQALEGIAAANHNKDNDEKEQGNGS